MNAPWTPHLLTVVGSVREVRTGPTVAAWFTDRVARRDDVTQETVDLRELGLREDLGDSPATEAFAAVVDRADAVVVVTPEYNHSYPASVKTAFDSLKAPWRAKPVGFVGYGGVGGGLRAVEHLRLVAAELHMVGVRTAVSVHRARAAFADGALTGEGAAIAEDAADEMVDQLAWWAAVLTPARAQRPYPG